MNQQKIIDPCEVRYNIKCKIIKKTRATQQGESQGQSVYDAILLVPDRLEDQTRLFFNAWLPEDNIENVEVMVEFPHPIFGRGRCYVLRNALDMREAHLMVSNLSIEEILKKMVDKSIRVTVLRASEEIEIDQDLIEKASM